TSGPTFGGVWDKETTEIEDNSHANCSVANYCGVPYSTAHMHNQKTFANNGWNFYTTWVMPTGGAGYPILQWQQPMNPDIIGSLFAGGKGTKEEAYLISSADHLKNLAYAVTIGATAQNAHYKLTADIYLNGEQMPVIGTQSNPFSGHFDGNGMT